MPLIGEECIWLPAIPNALLIFIFTIIVIPAGYFYARHCGVYSIDEDLTRNNKIIYTKIWMIFSQYIVQYILVILWSYYSFRIDVNYVGRNHPWLFIYCLIYVCYSITTTITFALYCHPTKQLYSTWLFVCLVLLLFPSIAILIALFVSEEEHKVAQFDAGLSQQYIKFCLCIDIGSFIASIFVAILFSHHVYVLIQTLFAPYLFGKDYLQYEPYYYSRGGGGGSITRNGNNILHRGGSDSESESEIDYNYREKIYDNGDITIHSNDYNQGNNHTNISNNDNDPQIMCSDDIEMVMT